MNIVLWIIQSALAMAFLMAGAMKALASRDVLREKIGDWVDEFSSATLKTIGILELLGAFGLILPMVLDIYPVLTSFAAFGLSLSMVGAILVHIKRKEHNKAIFNVILMVLGLSVALGRLMIQS
ncbi:MAG: DoxX family protein [Cyclobacteriaceae bacterium]|nr:DoxX family protein [Cyclobacteriaceae bacterium]